MTIQEIVLAYNTGLISKGEASIYVREYIEQQLLPDDFNSAICDAYGCYGEEDDCSDTALESASKDILEALNDTKEEVEGALIDLIKVIQNG